ncbi:MAG: hypothetical protein IID45_00400 [Planctomycetes bacterium]|nr:hypothetical protein [Planctomycetota bacterium]
MNERQTEPDHHCLQFAMAFRRWFLILVTPLILFLTIASVMQWTAFWYWLIN